MSGYPTYIKAVVAYMAILIAGATLTTMEVCGFSATDSFYYVVQTLWTVGYGRMLSIAIMLFGTVGITSALGVVGGMVLDRHAKRHENIEKELEESRRKNLEALYRWGEKKGFSKEHIDRVLEEIRDEQR